MRALLSHIKTTLAGIYPPEEIKSITHMLMESVCGLQPYQLLCPDDYSLSPTEEAKIKNIVSRLACHEPIQYILGKAEFCGMEFNVNPSVLIPRPETAELITLIKENLSSPNPRILDIGTGSGCIAVSLAKLIPDADVTAVDISKEALETARTNSSLNGVNVEFLEANALDEENMLDTLNGKFEIIVSNPPYIAEKERADMDRNVLDYEPSLALFVPNDDPLMFYKAISRLANRLLKPNGLLYFEINSGLGEETSEAVSMAGFGQVELIKDSYDKNRIIFAKI